MPVQKIVKKYPGDARARLIAARTRLYINPNSKQGWPFIGSLSMYLKVKEMPEDVREWCITNGQRPTIATNGMELIYAPDFIEECSDDELLALWAEEVSHIALKHPWRFRELQSMLGEADQQIANMAMDYAVHLIQESCEFTLPAGALINHKYRGMSMEQIYQILIEQAQKEPRGQPQDGDGRGNKSDNHVSPSEPEKSKDGQSDGPEKESSPKENLEKEWERRVATAAMEARARGDLPEEFERWIDKLENPKLPWDSILARFVLDSAKSDYRWLPPNRSFVHMDMYLPSLKSEHIDLAVAIDTSGSVGEDELKMFLSEPQGIVSSLPDFTLHLFGCDAAIHDHFVLTQNDDLQTQRFTGGGGGTRFEPVFERIKEEGIEPAVLIYITDLMGSFPDETPNYPVMWVATEDVHSDQVPFGEILRLEI